MKKLLLLLVLALLVTPSASLLAKGGGGGHSSGGGRSGFSSSRSSSTRSSSAPRASAPRASRPSVPKAPRVSGKPSANTVKVKSPAAKTVGGKSYGKTGSVVDGTYQPRFRGGYYAPVGSIVYYESRSFLDYLPFYMILASQQHREAVVSAPAANGQSAKDTVVKEEGTDSMYVWNWIFSIAVILALIALVVYRVNKSKY